MGLGKKAKDKGKELKGKDRAEAETSWKTMKSALEATNAAPDEIARMRKLVLGESGGAFDDIIDLVGNEDIVNTAGSDQRARERTLIWSGAGDLRSWRLDTFQEAARQGGRHGAVTVLDSAKARLKQFGFSDLLVVDNYLMAHGRRPYRGRRRILASLLGAEPS